MPPSLVVVEVQGGVAGRVRAELYLWLTVASISGGVSASILGYAAGEALGGGGLGVLAGALALFAAGWLLVSASLAYNILRILRGYGLAPFSPAGAGDEDVVRLVKDVVALYRGYRWHIVGVGAASVLVGAAFAALLVGWCGAGMGLGECAYRAGVAAVLIIYGVLDIYLAERSIARRLSRVRRIEDSLSRLVGEPGAGR